MTIETDDMDLAGDIVQSLANYMEIEVASPKSIYSYLSLSVFLAAHKELVFSFSLPTLLIKSIPLYVPRANDLLGVMGDAIRVPLTNTHSHRI